MRISIFGAFSAGKKCELYTGKYGKYDPNIKVLTTSMKRDNDNTTTPWKPLGG